MEEGEKVSDNLIKDKGISTSEEAVLPFEKPIKFNRIPADVRKRVDLYLLPVINVASPGRAVDIEAILKNTETLFINGPYYYDKDFWIQHCAASFREIIVFIYPEHFTAAHKNIPDSQNPDIEKTFLFIINALNYLSNVVHSYPSSKLIGDADKLYPNQGYGAMTGEDFSKIEVDFLEHLCIDIVYALYFIFTKYCVNNK
jgi:hypothetical protein